MTNQQRCDKWQPGQGNCFGKLGCMRHLGGKFTSDQPERCACICNCDSYGRDVGDGGMCQACGIFTGEGDPEHMHRKWQADQPAESVERDECQWVYSVCGRPKSKHDGKIVGHPFTQQPANTDA